jgi:hypothetical protein
MLARTKEGVMGFLDKLLGRGKDAAEDVGETAKDLGDKTKDAFDGDKADDELSETGQAEQRLDNVRDQALRDEGRMP